MSGLAAVRRGEGRYPAATPSPAEHLRFGFRRLLDSPHAREYREAFRDHHLDVMELQDHPSIAGINEGRTFSEQRRVFLAMVDAVFANHDWSLKRWIELMEAAPYMYVSDVARKRIAAIGPQEEAERILLQGLCRYIVHDHAWSSLQGIAQEGMSELNKVSYLMTDTIPEPARPLLREWVDCNWYLLRYQEHLSKMGEAFFAPQRELDRFFVQILGIELAEYLKIFASAYGVRFLSTCFAVTTSPLVDEPRQNTVVIEASPALQAMELPVMLLLPFLACTIKNVMRGVWHKERAEGESSLVRLIRGEAVPRPSVLNIKAAPIDAQTWALEFYDGQGLILDELFGLLVKACKAESAKACVHPKLKAAVAAWEGGDCFAFNALPFEHLLEAAFLLGISGEKPGRGSGLGMWGMAALLAKLGAQLKVGVMPGGGLYLSVVLPMNVSVPPAAVEKAAAHHWLKLVEPQAALPAPALIQSFEPEAWGWKEEWGAPPRRWQIADIIEKGIPGDLEFLDLRAAFLVDPAKTAEAIIHTRGWHEKLVGILSGYNRAFLTELLRKLIQTAAALGPIELEAVASIISFLANEFYTGTESVRDICHRGGMCLLDLGLAQEFMDVCDEENLEGQFVRSLVDQICGEVLSSPIERVGPQDQTVTARLVVVDEEEEGRLAAALSCLRPHNIVVTAHYPTNYAGTSKVAAMITEDAAEPSHAMRRAAACGAALGRLPGGPSFLKLLEGKWVTFEAGGILRLANEEEVRTARQKFGLLEISPPRVGRDNILLLEEAAALPEPRLLSLVGPKAAKLVDLRRRGFPVPPAVFFTAAFNYQLHAGDFPAQIKRVLGRHPLGEGMPAVRQKLEKIRELYLTATVPGEVVVALMKAGARLPGVARILRPGLIFEDQPGFSAAGFSDSPVALNNEESLVHALLAGLASYWNELPFMARIEQGLDHFGYLTGGTLMQLIIARAAGAMLVDRGGTTIYAVPGQGQGAMSGRIPADKWVVNPQGEARMERAGKRQTKLVFSDGQILETALTDAEQGPAIDEKTARGLANLGQQAYAVYGPQPRDMEWVLGEGGIWIVQDRPDAT